MMHIRDFNQTAVADVPNGGPPIRPTNETPTARSPRAAPEVVPSSHFRYGHRVLNLALLCLALPLAAPLILIVAFANAIALGSLRKVFFLQDRVGQGGKVFRIFKFRTMESVPFPVRNANQSALRVTYLGRILRNTHLDELPQLLNVLRGEMCFLGPRPEMVAIEEWARDHVSGFAAQHAVKPGISGLAQITQGYVPCEEEGYAIKLAHNLSYIRNASLGLDISIILRTAWWMLRGRGSSFEAPVPECDDAYCDGVTIRHCVRAFLDRLEDRAVPHAALRGTEILEPGGSADDVDMLLAGTDLARFEEHLEWTCHRFGATIFERHHSGALHQYYLHARTPGGEHEFIGIDVHTSECCFGIPYLTAEELLSEIRITDTAQLTEAAGAVVNFLTPLMAGAVIHPRHGPALREVCVDHRPEAERLLGQVFGARRGSRILDLLCRDELECLKRDVHSARRAFLWHAFLRHPLRSIKGLAVCIYGNRVRPLLRPRGRFIAFLGTDGSGKTTLIDAVEKRLSRVFRSDRSRVFHMRPGLLPQINTIMHLGKTTYSLADMSRPHRAAPSGVIGSNLRLLYYWADYILGYALLVLPRRRRHSLILFDRYFFDYRVDPLRSRIRRGGRLGRRLMGRVPQPDQVFVCSAPSTLVLRRKQELPEPEVERQVAAYEQLAREEGYKVIRTDGSVRAGVDQVLDSMFPVRERSETQG